MNVLDLLIVAMIAFSVYEGMRSGILRTASSVVGLVIGVAFSSSHYGRLAGELAPMVHSLAVAEAIWFSLLILLAVVAATMLGHQMQAAYDWHGHGQVDRVLGSAIGLFRGVLMGMICLMIVAAFFPKSQTLLEAHLTKYFFGPTEMVTSITSNELKQRVFDGLESLPGDGSGSGDLH